MAVRAREEADDTRPIPASLPTSDKAKWDAMTPKQRTRAAARLDAIERWRVGELPLDDAVVAYGLSRERV